MMKLIQKYDSEPKISPKQTVYLILRTYIRHFRNFRVQHKQARAMIKLFSQKYHLDNELLVNLIADYESGSLDKLSKEQKVRILKAKYEIQKSESNNSLRIQVFKEVIPYLETRAELKTIMMLDKEAAEFLNTDIMKQGLVLKFERMSLWLRLIRPEGQNYEEKELSSESTELEV